LPSYGKKGKFFLYFNSGLNFLCGLCFVGGEGPFLLIGYTKTKQNKTKQNEKSHAPSKRRPPGAAALCFASRLDRLQRRP